MEIVRDESVQSEFWTKKLLCNGLKVKVEGKIRMMLLLTL